MRTFVLVAAFVAVTMCPAATAAETGRMLTVVGYLENAELLPMEFPIQAKMDTGTTTTSINALDIQRYRKEGEDWVSFEVAAGDRSLKLRRRVERIVCIRRTGTSIIERPVVRIGLCIAGYYKRAQMTLANRSKLSYPLLVGRRYMSTGGLVIDSAATFVSKPACAGVPKR